MALTNIELYEALKRDLNEEAARRIAEVVPAAADLATRSDLAATRTELAATRTELERSIESVRTDLSSQIGRLEVKMERLHSSTLRWMIGLFLPAWAVTAGTLLTLVLKS